MKDLIKKLVNKSLLKEDRKIKVFTNEIREIFIDTKVYNNNKLITEIVDTLITSPNNFIDNLCEGLEEEMMDALLDICVLTFSDENSKMDGNVTTFSLPAGWSCPFAKACLKKVKRDRFMDPEKEGTFKISKKTGEKVPYKGDVQVSKGKDAEFDCYAANQEMQYDAVRANRWHNYDLLIEAGKEGGSDAQSDLILRSLEFHFDSKGKNKKVRIHESGDFYNGEYLKAWMTVAEKLPDIEFYAYTKSVPYVKSMEEKLKGIPNLSITLSKGGRRDSEISDLDIKESHVFNTPEEVLEAGLIVDLDDSLAQKKGGKDSSFALLVHGTQEKGEMSQNKMRNETFMAYWKYRTPLNRFFNRPKNHYWTADAGKTGLKVINNILNDKNKKTKYKEADLKFKKKLLNYVVKYHEKYDFSEELKNILPPKYR